jgi:outer membrane protein assembly factor BamB
MTLITRSLVLACLLSSTFSATAADWPQWRGPQRDGISAETRLLKEWPKDGPKLLWHAEDIGFGYSTPAVVGERLYILSNEGAENEFVQALNVNDGGKVWSARLGKVGPNTPAMNYPGARSTPTVVGDTLYALGSDGDLAAIETATGKIKWQKSLRSDFGGKPGDWAYSESPLVDGDTLVVTPGGTEATIIALNRNTGETIWKSAIPGGDEAGYSSAIAVEIGDVKQYVQFLAKGLVGVDARTGKLLWRYETTAKGSPANIPTPVEHDGYIYSSTTRTGGGLIKLKVADGNVIAEEIYFSPRLPNAIGGVVKVGDHIYGTSARALMAVQFATGDVKWQDRAIGAASITCADGHLYLHGENGDVLLAEATPDEYREKGRFTPPDQPDRGRSKAWAYPVVANGKLYIRDATSLWCYDVTQ